MAKKNELNDGKPPLKERFDQEQIKEQSRKLSGGYQGPQKVYALKKINVLLPEPFHKKLKMIGVQEDFNMQDKVTELIISYLNTKSDIV